MTVSLDGVAMANTAARLISTSARHSFRCQHLYVHAAASRGVTKLMLRGEKSGNMLRGQAHAPPDIWRRVTPVGFMPVTKPEPLHPRPGALLLVAGPAVALTTASPGSGVSRQ